MSLHQLLRSHIAGCSAMVYRVFGAFHSREISGDAKVSEFELYGYFTAFRLIFVGNATCQKYISFLYVKVEYFLLVH